MRLMHIKPKLLESSFPLEQSDLSIFRLVFIDNFKIIFEANTDE